MAPRLSAARTRGGNCRRTRAEATPPHRCRFEDASSVSLKTPGLAGRPLLARLPIAHARASSQRHAVPNPDRHFIAIRRRSANDARRALITTAKKRGRRIFRGRDSASGQEACAPGTAPRRFSGRWRAGGSDCRAVSSAVFRCDGDGSPSGFSARRFRTGPVGNRLQAPPPVQTGSRSALTPQPAARIGGFRAGFSRRE